MKDSENNNGAISPDDAGPPEPTGSEPGVSEPKGPASDAKGGKPAEASDYGAFQPMQGSRLALLTLALATAAFMQILDSTIANVAIPTISGNLGASSTQGTWVITSFSVANAIALPITGWMAKRFGEVRLFIWSTILFTIASFLCGVSTSLGMLVVSRVLQGAVAGPMIPLSLSLLLANYPAMRRGMALSLWTMTVIVAPIFGPIVGGYISDNYQWGWIFFINVPIGIFVAILSRVLLKGRETLTSARPMNYTGLALLVIGIGALQYMLDRGKELDWFNSNEIIIFAIMAVVGITFLVAWEMTDENPIIDLSLFKSRNFSLGVTCIGLGMLVYYGSIILLPLLLQTHFGYTASLSGLASAPVGVLPVLLSPVIGRFANRIDMRILATFSFAIFAACFHARAFLFTPDMNMGIVALLQFLQGIGVACFFMPLNSIAYSELRPNQLAAAASLSNFIRMLCASIGASITTTFWERREALHHTRLTEFINPFSQATSEAYQRLMNLGYTQDQAQAKLAREITRQGFIMSANELYWLFSILFLCLIFVIWFSRHKSGQVATSDGAH